MLLLRLTGVNNICGNICVAAIVAAITQTTTTTTKKINIFYVNANNMFYLFLSNILNVSNGCWFITCEIYIFYSLISRVFRLFLAVSTIVTSQRSIWELCYVTAFTACALFSHSANRFIKSTVCLMDGNWDCLWCPGISKWEAIKKKKWLWLKPFSSRKLPGTFSN